jgi:hypothetical protein
MYSELLDRLQIAADRAFRVVAPTEFFQHPLAVNGSREPPFLVTQPYPAGVTFS